MKSKTSFFNKQIFKKNITLYWPIWLCYMLYGVAKLGGGLWSGLRQVGQVTEERKLIVLTQALSLEVDIWVIAGMSVITGMALFSYLFSSKSANMIHALPVTRKELFCTNVLSGLSFMWFPQLLTFILAVFVALANGISFVQYLAMWLLSVMGISFFLFSVVAFCAMFTGQLFALPLYFVAVNFVTVGFMVGVKSVISFLGYGVDYNSLQELLLLRVLSPINYMQNNIRFVRKSQFDAIGYEVVTGVDYRGGILVICYALAGLLIYLFAYYGYKKRKIECAGDLITFGWVKPVFRWSVGICVAYACAVVFSNFLDTVLIWVNARMFYGMVLLLGMIAFVIADMFVQKSFRVIKKKRIKEFALYLFFLSTSFGIVHLSSEYLQNKVPEADQVQAAYVQLDYPAEFEGAEIKDVIDMQRKILDHTVEFQKDVMKQAETSISIIYKMKDGQRISRTYRIPLANEEAVKLAKQAYQYETQADCFLVYQVGCDYKDIRNMGDSMLQYYDKATNGYMNRAMSVDTAYALYQAMIRDVEAGVLQKYNTTDYTEPEELDDFEALPCLSLSYYHSSNTWQDIYMKMNDEKRPEQMADGDVNSREGFTYLNFGPDCTNIIQALIDNGVIESEDELVYRSDQ